MFASADQQRLRWIQQNQAMFRAARFNNLEDATADDPDNFDLNEIGSVSFCRPPTLVGPAIWASVTKILWLLHKGSDLLTSL